MVKHLNTFSRAKYTPTYSKQGTSSLVRLGFTAYHDADISRRPKIPNASDTSAYMLNLILTLPHNPPFHTEVEIPPLLGVSCETLFARPTRNSGPLEREQFTQISCGMPCFARTLLTRSLTLARISSILLQDQCQFIISVTCLLIFWTSYRVVALMPSSCLFVVSFVH